MFCFRSIHAPTPVRQTHIQKIERLTGQPPERATLRYFIRARSRHGAWTWFHRELVPDFDGRFAWFRMRTHSGAAGSPCAGSSPRPGRSNPPVPDPREMRYPAGH
jgi:hypothetical protein